MNRLDDRLDVVVGAPVKAPRSARRGFLCVLLVAALTFLGAATPPEASSAADRREGQRWVGTWAAAPQFAIPARAQTFRNQTLRLVVHTSIGGKRVRVKLSNVFGDQPLAVGAAHVARRASGADIDPASDRVLTFGGRMSTTIPARSMAVSDPVELDVPALSDLAVSIFLPESTQATTTHTLAKQTNYVSDETGDSTAAARFPASKTIFSWPFLTGVDVAASPRAASVVAFGSSTTDGDGSTRDANRRWPDVLAERLQKEAGGNREIGVLNEGIIGNRLLSDFDSPRQSGGPFEEVFKRLGPIVGQAGLARFDRDVLSQAGVRYVVLALGINDILFPGSFIPASEEVSARSIIDGNRQLIARAHKNGIRVVETTIPPFEGAVFTNPTILFSTPEHEKVRQEVNAWIRTSREFDAFVDLDAVVRDPARPARLLPAYDSGDHLHVNDAANVAQANAFPLKFFTPRRS